MNATMIVLSKQRRTARGVLLPRIPTKTVTMAFLATTVETNKMFFPGFSQILRVCRLNDIFLFPFKALSACRIPKLWAAWIKNAIDSQLASKESELINDGEWHVTALLSASSGEGCLSRSPAL
jgi:hypothetical protein